MIKPGIKILTILGILLSSKLALAQSLDPQLAQEQERDDTLIVNLHDYLPPLNVMIDSAVANAPQVEYFLQRQKMFEYEESMVKKEWMNNIRFSANYFSGSNALIEGNLALSGYNYGVGVQIPIGMIFTQHDKVKMAEAASLSEAAKRREQEIQIRLQVEKTYSRLFMLKDLIEHATEAKESARFIYEQAETRFVRGELSLDELGQNNDLKTKWASQYTTLKNDFYDTYRMLELLVGVPFSKFNME